MKVALTFPGCHRRGGVERVILECANFLQSRGHETHLYASEWDEDLLHSGVYRHLVAANRRFSVARIINFARRIEKEMANADPAGSDVIGAYGILAPPGSVVWAQSVHGAWLEISRRQRGPAGRLKQRLNLNHPVILAMERKYFRGRRYKKMIALSSQVKADLMRLYQVPSEDIVVIPNGFAPGEFNVRQTEAHRDEMRNSLGYSSQDKVVIFVANELERKGFGPLLRSLAQIRDPKLRLLVVGRVSSTAYESEIEKLGMGDRVRFSGPTSNVVTYYAAADVFALPTQYEAWGLVIVEAMACGLPVLTSRLAGASIAVREGESGYLLEDPSSVPEIKDKLADLLASDLSSRRDFISDSVKPYAWPNVLLEYEKVLEECRAPKPSIIAAPSRAEGTGTAE